MPTYVQQTTNSDLSPSWLNTTSFDKEISVGAGGDGSVVVSLSSDERQSAGLITPAGVPNTEGWENGGTWTVEIEIDVSNHQIVSRCRVVRLSSTGTVLQVGSFSDLQTLSASRTFSPVAPTWTGGEDDCDNRLAIEIEFLEVQGMANSITVGLGTTANEVITDVSEDGCAVDAVEFAATESGPEAMVPTKPPMEAVEYGDVG